MAIVATATTSMADCFRIEREKLCDFSNSLYCLSFAFPKYYTQIGSPLPFRGKKTVKVPREKAWASFLMLQVKHASHLWKPNVNKSNNTFFPAAIQKKIQFSLFSDTSWPGVTKLPDFKAQFPRWEPQSLSTLLPVTLSAQGQDLFQVMKNTIKLNICHQPNGSFHFSTL